MHSAMEARLSPEGAPDLAAFIMSNDATSGECPQDRWPGARITLGDGRNDRR